MKTTLMDRQAIKQQAALWLVKDELTPEDNQALIRWLNQSSEHQTIYQQLAAKWQALGEIVPQPRDIDEPPVTDTAVQAPNTPAQRAVDAEESPTRKPRRLIVWWGMAASLVLTLCASLWWPHPTNHYHLSSNVAEQKQLMLPDGSTIKLNADSRVAIAFDDDKRQVYLLHGDAHFEVAKDTARPFKVRYQDHEFVALGTAFTVNTRPHLQLKVTEHQVRVDDIRVVEEGHAVTHQDHWQLTQPITAGPDWQRRQLSFEQQPFKEILAQLQPYIDAPIYLMATSEGNELISGTLDLNQPKQALALIAAGMGLQVKHQNQMIRLSK